LMQSERARPSEFSKLKSSPGALLAQW
jgi:hypothetical protein